jgi:hypothetical protein
LLWLLLERIEPAQLLTDGDDHPVAERGEGEHHEDSEQREEPKLANPQLAPARPRRLGAVSAQKRHEAAGFYRRCGGLRPGR